MVSVIPSSGNADKPVFVVALARRPALITREDERVMIFYI